MKKTLLISILALSLLFTGCTGESAGENEMSLLAINVRKADALLLRCGTSAYLIDTGTKKSADDMLAVLRGEGITRLNGVILTHTHADHVGGLKALLESGIEIENIYTSKYYVLKKEDGKHPVDKAIKKKDYEVTYLAAGDTLPLDGGKLTVVGPLEKNEEAENCNSLVLLAEGGGGSILLTGDMEFPEEASLLDAGLIPHADVLKIANHGESDATSDALVAAVSPSLAVISTNTVDEPDTPDPRVMRLLSGAGIPVLITQDSEKGILVTLRDGEVITEIK
ncbi:ComEC/Rec2 family competence protein [Aristaeella lactis]|uniref:Competence protein ComEC n=1 Tax=Aristaeella lactis TaxID=3046383 RepID=A0AC61PMJ7_9FIRM|nr:MBL fold metallo-hydrolase [Aristaeella lactis]QUA53188.1 MBL fold metallo-hydrolase [Aristaeella lactis]SMC68751.1 competence protein ComEC [Aristaeella lactis]